MTVLSYSLRSHGDGHLRFSNGIEQLGSTETMHRKVYRRALNKVGDKAYTRVIRAVGKQMGLKRVQVLKYGGVGKVRANFTRQDYQIVSRGEDVPLREFGAKQFSYGVRARPWGKATRFTGMFIMAGRWSSGDPIAQGHVFQRVTSSSLPIEKQFGPNVPEEIVRNESADAFHAVADELPGRIAHEIAQVTREVVG